MIFFWPEVHGVYILSNSPSSKQWKILVNQKISTHLWYFSRQRRFVCIFYLIPHHQNSGKYWNFRKFPLTWDKVFHVSIALWCGHGNVTPPPSRSGTSIRPRESTFPAVLRCRGWGNVTPPILARTCRFGFRQGTITIIFPAALGCLGNGPVNSMSIFLSGKMRRV